MPLNVLKSIFVRHLAGACAAVCAIVEPSLAASEFVDKAANVLAIFIIIAVPIGGIVLFWLVHIIPEKIAEKRQHPQKDAIHMLCLLSLVFGGLLWPLAWLWAYTKPVLHQMAYGRDKHEDYYAELPGEAQTGTSPLRLHEELGLLRHDLEQLEKRGESTDAMKGIRERLARLERRTALESTTGGAP
jgi:CBS domain containing-hemolysin-like protein